MWCEDSKIIIVLNKCDLWDDSKTGKFETWDEKYDYYTTQRQACRIEIDFKFPVFTTLYLTDFKARLNLTDATLSLTGSSPFGKLDMKAFIDHQSGILFCAQYWKSIWNRSFMDYGDDYLKNLWYLTMYYANASQGGKYPRRFNNGLWGWNHDVQQWNFYFHWNQQQLYLLLNAAGFHNLVAP